MDRQMLERHLALAKAHVSEGQRHIRDQIRVIRELERDGHDTAVARQLLTTLRATQALHIADRDRSVKEWAQETKPGRA